MSGARWAGAVVVAVAAWVGAVVLAVAVAVDGVATDEPQSLDADDYVVEVARCAPPDEADGESAPEPTRVARGTLTNTTDERRSFRLQVKFETADSVRVDWAPAVVDQLGAGETALWEAASYVEPAGDEGVTCDVGLVDLLSETTVLTGAGAGALPALPPVSFSTSDNVDEAGPEGASGGAVGDIDAVAYICYVVSPRVPVTCGTVSN